MWKAIISTALIFVSAFLLTRDFLVPEVVPACAEPVEFTIGVFDRRFGLTYQEFLNSIVEAEGIWEEASGRNLFSYSPQSNSLPINLIYDYRQQVTEELSNLEGEVKETEATYRTLEARYISLKSVYDLRQQSFSSALNELEKRNAEYEERVDTWNASRRNSQTEFEALEAERLAINQIVENLRVEENEINHKAREINLLVDRLNRVSRNLNLSAEEYNTIGAARGETFEGGVYEIDSTGERINIYEFSNRDKLVRLIAHELGHALGLGHISDPEAIMYELNESGEGKLTTSDLEALEKLCAN